MPGAKLHFGSCPEDRILNLLHATIKALQKILHSERTSSKEAHGSEFIQASAHPLGHGDSARALMKVFHLFKEWSVLHMHRVGSLRETLNTTVNTLMGQDKHMLPKREAQAKQLGKLCWREQAILGFLHALLFCKYVLIGVATLNISVIDCPAGFSRDGHFHKHVFINDLIQSVLGDVHTIDKMLVLITSKFDKAITIVSEAKLQSAEAETTRDDLVSHDLMVHIKDRLVLPQISSKEQCGPQNTDPKCTFNVSNLSDIQKTVVLQSSLNTQAETHAVYERKINPHDDDFNESPDDHVRPEDDRILHGVLNSQRNDGLRPFGENDVEVKKEPLQEDERDKKAEKFDTVVMEEHSSWTQNSITVG